MCIRDSKGDREKEKQKKRAKAEAAATAATAAVAADAPDEADAAAAADADDAADAAPPAATATAAASTAGPSAWEAFGLHAELVGTLTRQGFTTPTPKKPAFAPFGSFGQIVVPKLRAPAYGLFPLSFSPKELGSIRPSVRTLSGEGLFQ